MFPDLPPIADIARRLYRAKRCAATPAMAIAPLVIRWGPETFRPLRRSAHCIWCGRKHATLRPSELGKHDRSFEEFSRRARADVGALWRCGRGHFEPNEPAD